MTRAAGRGIVSWREHEKKDIFAGNQFKYSADRTVFSGVFTMLALADLGVAVHMAGQLPLRVCCQAACDNSLPIAATRATSVCGAPVCRGRA